MKSLSMSDIDYYSMHQEGQGTNIQAIYHLTGLREIFPMSIFNNDEGCPWDLSELGFQGKAEHIVEVFSGGKHAYGRYLGNPYNNEFSWHLMDEMRRRPAHHFFWKFFCDKLMPHSILETKKSRIPSSRCNIAKTFGSIREGQQNMVADLHRLNVDWLVTYLLKFSLKKVSNPVEVINTALQEAWMEYQDFYRNQAWVNHDAWNYVYYSDDYSESLLDDINAGESCHETEDVTNDWFYTETMEEFLLGYLNCHANRVYHSDNLPIAVVDEKPANFFTPNSPPHKYGRIGNGMQFANLTYLWTTNPAIRELMMYIRSLNPVTRYGNAHKPEPVDKILLRREFLNKNFGKTKEELIELWAQKVGKVMFDVTVDLEESDETAEKAIPLSVDTLREHIRIARGRNQEIA